jgi:hypothetical protein
MRTCHLDAEALEGAAALVEQVVKRRRRSPNHQ